MYTYVCVCVHIYIVVSDSNVELFIKKVRLPALIHCHVKLMISSCAVFMSHSSSIPLMYKLHES